MTEDKTKQELCEDGLPCDNPNGDHCRCTKASFKEYRKRKAKRNCCFRAKGMFRTGSTSFQSALSVEFP